MDIEEARKRLEYIIYGFPCLRDDLTDLYLKDLRAWKKSLSLQDKKALFVRVINHHSMGVCYLRCFGDFLDCRGCPGEAIKWYLEAADRGDTDVESGLQGIYTRTRNFWSSGGGYTKNLKPKIKRYVDHKRECREHCERERAGLEVHVEFLFRH